jgi:hypothetical protein
LSYLVSSLSLSFTGFNGLQWRLRTRKDIRVKLEVISHPEERYSASGVPRDDVSMEVASRVTELGTSLLCLVSTSTHAERPIRKSNGIGKRGQGRSRRRRREKKKNIQQRTKS